MSPFDQKAVLESMTVICDTREHDTEAAERRYKTFGVPYSRAALSYGDYTYNCTLPSGMLLYKAKNGITAKCVVERKESLDELASCFTHSRDRFGREFNRAMDNGASIYVVVENATWENLLNHRYRSKFHPNAYMASIMAFMVRYHSTIMFCKAETSGILIKEILYRDLKERLERGELDEQKDQ